MHRHRVPGVHCHGLPERCLTFRGRVLPLCARCTGILGGYGLGVLCLLVRGPFGGILHGALMLPLALDGTLQLYTRYESGNGRRLITGLLFGFGLVVTAFGVMHHGFAFGRTLAAQGG